MVDSTDARLLALVERSDGMSRVELQSRLGLPAATVTSAAGRLLARGDLVEAPDPVRRRKAGRRPGLLRTVGPRALLGVVSWSREQLRSTVVTYGGEIVAQADHDPEGPDVLTAPMAALQADHGGRLTAVVVGVPAPYQRGVGSPTYRRSGPPRPDQSPPSWIAAFDTDPAAAWTDRLGVQVLFENDANLAMIGEAAVGVASGLRDVVYLKVGERSTGSGLLVGGRIHRGASGFAGEIAHVHVDDDGPLCSCGGRGCLATKLGPALLASIREAYDPTVTFADVLRLADAGDPGPARILGDVGRIVGRALADLVTFLNPAAIVVDGSLEPAARFVVDGLRDPIDRYASPVAATAVRILVGTLGHRADLHGAIALTRSEALHTSTV